MPLIGNVSSVELTHGTSDPTSDTGQSGDIYIKTEDAEVKQVHLKEGANWNVIGATNTQTGRLLNGTIVASVAGNALTIAFKTLNGEDPSSTNQVMVSFRETDGSYTTIIVEAPTSLTISNGSKLGTINSTPFRIWVVLFNIVGAVYLGVRNCSTATAIFPLAEYGLASSIAEGGAGAADSAGVFYTEAAASNRQFRTFGFMDWNSGLGAAGVWSAAPSIVQLFGPGIKLPGEVVQSQYNISTTFTTGTTAAIPFDDTIPQSTEGEEFFQTPITPTSAANLLVNTVTFNCSHENQTTVMLCLFKDSDADAISVAWNSVLAAAAAMLISLVDYRRAASANQITFKVRAGGITNGSVYMNGTAGARYLGGVLTSSHIVQEIMG